MNKPKPLPPPACNALAWNCIPSWKSFVRLSALKPAPSSATETTACVAPSSSSTSNVTMISSLANFTALDSKLRSTEFIFTVSTSATASSDVLPRGGTPWVLSQKVSLTLRASADT